MHPILLELDLGAWRLVLPAYGTFLVLGAVVAGLLAVKAAGSPGVKMRPRRAALLYATAVGAGLIGARLLDVALDLGAYAADPTLVTALEPRGFAQAGGFAAAGIVALLLARWWRDPAGALADSAVVPVAAGIVLLRVGCFLNGCCAGEVTTLPWGVTFPYGSTAWGQQVLSGETGILGLAGHVEPVHPTQLYEATAVMLCALLATGVRRGGSPAGTSALAFALLFLAFRAANQVLRPDLPGASLPHDVLVGAYAAVAVIAAAMLAVRLSRPRPRALSRVVVR